MPVELCTFSIAARCERSGMLGVAVSTAVPAVGSLVPFARARLGAVATQARVNLYLGIDALRLLEQGLDARATLEQVIAADPGRALRQIGVVDREGRSAAWTGPECGAWAGHRLGPGFAVQGNILVGPETLEAMEGAFLRRADLDLPERLLVALEAGQAAGGDRRGRQSAALYVVDREEFPACDLRVDEHPDPVAELRRVFEVARVQLFPYLRGLPTRERPLGDLPPEFIELLRKPPAERQPRHASGHAS